jgi:hypothetical protein
LLEFLALLFNWHQEEVHLRLQTTLHPIIPEIKDILSSPFLLMLQNKIKSSSLCERIKGTNHKKRRSKKIIKK